MEVGFGAVGECENVITKRLLITSNGVGDVDLDCRPGFIAVTLVMGCNLVEEDMALWC
jgi:hypothetical protein